MKRKVSLAQRSNIREIQSLIEILSLNKNGLLERNKNYTRRKKGRPN